MLTITNAFQKILDMSGCKQMNMWIDEGSKYQTRSIKTWLQSSNIEMYLVHNEIIIINAKRYIRASRNKTYKYMAVI